MYLISIVSSSTAFTFANTMSEKCKSTSPSAIQVKHWQKTVSIEKLLEAISWLEKGEWIVDTCHNVRTAHSCTHTICANADRIKESAKSRTKVFVYVARLPQSYQNEPHQKLCIPVSYIFIALEINKYLYINVCLSYRNVYTLYIWYIHTLYVCMSTSGIVIHYIGWGCKCPNPQEIQCFKWVFCIQFAQCFSGI